MDTRQQRKRMSSENRGQTGLGYVESRLRKMIVNPVVSTDDWYTPRWIIDTLGPFDCDRRLRQSGIEGKYVVLNM